MSFTLFILKLIYVDIFSLLEENCEQENKTSTYSRSSKKIIHKR